MNNLLCGMYLAGLPIFVHAEQVALEYPGKALSRSLRRLAAPKQAEILLAQL